MKRWRPGLACALFFAIPCAWAQAVAVTRIEVGAQAVGELACPFTRPAARPAPRTPDPDPLVPPPEQDVRAALAEGQEAGGDAAPARLQALPRRNGTFRVGIWGDSHIAAAFFTEEMVRAAGLAPAQAGPRFLPATLQRAGMRLPLKRECVSPGWRHEPAYANVAAAERPGPALADLVSAEPGAEFSFDLRSEALAQRASTVRLLYEQTAEPLRVAVSVDGGAETEVDLHEAPGPAAVELAAPSPLSQVRLRLLQGTLRFHGIEVPPAPAQPLQLDVFGYPGATVAGWARTDPQRLAAWAGADGYDFVLLAFGTNEANDTSFNADAYQRMLDAAVAKLRAAFPAAQCLLLAPGDRGVLVRRKAGRRQAASVLLRYARLHATVGRIQREVAARAGCMAWSAQQAMGGPGSAYAWRSEQPPLMAPDLIHFTPRGYRRLAGGFAAALGWTGYDWTAPR